MKKSFMKIPGSGGLVSVCRAKGTAKKERGKNYEKEFYENPRFGGLVSVCRAKGTAKREELNDKILHRRNL
ncbi:MULTISPECIES: hypothetical protein [Caproicibacterium]|uniref:Uncharacterized protein n=1 Tax=Caproicibacterium argilliputei TaxID=3030016 RepID=A0AA97DCQ9_9FIRM|nr:hypothetical protein [Caproicibacterium argilliputei]WOC33143.1 hypothetical protein PXC00_04500 [Caproicibacterium argilliputei]